MAKPAAERLDLARYPWTIETLPRFGDMDALRHLNNVAIALIYEDARSRFQHGLALHRLLAPKHGFVIAEIAIQYLGEGAYPDALTVACGYGAAGRASFPIAQALFQNGRCIGTADATLVHVDRSTGRPVPLPEGARALLLAHRFDDPSSDPATAQDTGAR